MDKRTKRLYPTALGSATLDAIAGAVDAAQGRILTPLAPAQRRRFMTMLTRLVDINNVHSRAPLRPAAGNGGPVEDPPRG